ncbi:MAG TPA: cation transporter, partial [Pseudomonas sp.]|nr:cation transporter [Pseudomonas sp.]
VVTHQPHTADRYKAALQPFAQLVHITAEVNRCGESAHLDSRQ